MKRRLHVTGLAFLAMTTLGATAAAEEKFQKLTGAQIRGKFGGMELTDSVTAKWKVISTSTGRKRTGKWRVEKDQLCIEFEQEPIPKCYDGVALGQAGRAAARRSIAVAGDPRILERT
jgi:hypothetical protein